MSKGKKVKGGGFDEETIAARIPLGEMLIDETYQGPVSTNLVAHIAKNWDDGAAGAIILNLRDDGTYAVLDGQHRVIAARDAGVTELAAMVFIGKSHMEEAKLFVQLNTKHNVLPVARFKANLEAGLPDELTIRAVLREVGLEVGYGGARSNPDVTRAVSPLYYVYRNFGVQHLKTVVGILTSAFHEYPDRGRAYGEAGLLGMSGFLSRYPNADINKLITKLKGVSPTTIIGRAQSERKGYEATWSGWGRAITSIYNTGVVSYSKIYLNPNAWDKSKYTPKGKELIAKSTARQESARNAGKAAVEHFKRIRTENLAKAAKDKKE